MSVLGGGSTSEPAEALQEEEGVFEQTWCQQGGRDLLLAGMRVCISTVGNQTHFRVTNLFVQNHSSILRSIMWRS